jgi:uncharacterized membrane protein YidH (DUF202 family)
MKHISFRTLIPAFIFATPAVLSAQVDNIFDAGELIYNILEKLGYFFWILALLVLFWGLVKFINNAADTKEHEYGKHLIIWGLISFLVLVSLWAIVRLILVDTLGIDASLVCYVTSDGNQICP